MQSKKLLGLVMLFLLVSFSIPSSVSGGFGDLLKGAKEQFLGGQSELSESTIIDGLKEALHIGAGNAVGFVSKMDGYYKNPRIKIPLPDAVQKVEKILRSVGYGPKIDASELSMNRAAEKAAPEAEAMFWDTIKNMSFSDARKILNGRENEATLYFKDKTQARLGEKFKPIVHDVMSSVGVTRKYQELDSKVSTIPFAESMSFDLDKYVTDGALDGLFLMLAEEEKKIRQNPAARVTDLLKKVFGK